MTTIEKLNLIHELYLHDLNDWCREFITDIYDNVQDEDELTERQISKINEIFEDCGGL